MTPKFPGNIDKFEQVKKLHLPLGSFAITSSGPLGARDLRAIGDVDIVVTNDLWDKLEAQYGLVVEDDVRRIKIGDLVEVLGGRSLFNPETPPTVMDQIEAADIIDGLPFVSLEHILHFKRLMGRPKDIADIALVERYLAENPRT